MCSIIKTFLTALFLIGALGTGRADQLEPFGIHSVAINNGFPVEIWRRLKPQLDSDAGFITSCGSSQRDECAAAFKLSTIIESARGFKGKAFLGHLNRSINLSIKPGPGKWTSVLNALESGVGDCKAYAVTKYVALLVAGFAQDQIRLVAVHKRLSNEDHLVVAVREDGHWFILDNLHHLILPASEEIDYDPLYVLDDTGVHKNVSLGEVDQSHPTASKGHQARGGLRSAQ